MLLFALAAAAAAPSSPEETRLLRATNEWQVCAEGIAVLTRDKMPAATPAQLAEAGALACDYEQAVVRALAYAFVRKMATADLAEQKADAIEFTLRSTVVNATRERLERAK